MNQHKKQQTVIKVQHNCLGQFENPLLNALIIFSYNLTTITQIRFLLFFVVNKLDILCNSVTRKLLRLPKFNTLC